MIYRGRSSKLNTAKTILQAFSSQGLAVLAENRAALTEADFYQWCLAVQAGLVRAPVNQELLREVTGLAIAADKIAQCRATALNGAPQNLFDVLHEALALLSREGLPLPLWVDACQKQRFVGVDIADSHHQMAVHNQRFDRLFAVF